ncbi:unnamed protein product [Psylliodes chrysocephalus]|uniref:Uncharacterized protein n=1 Tax=Psylliodes chrysocephalus TaxID=3402493 RepID=A0A9P0GFL8_9CUCU|nr:unnamed protein product [Psylliodes chrysocephala]
MAQGFVGDSEKCYNRPHNDYQFQTPKSDLTEEQKKKFFTFKLQYLRENHKYLKEHPEIKTLINLLLHTLMRARPEEKDIQEFIADFLTDNFRKIERLLYRPQTKEEEKEEPVHLHTNLLQPCQSIHKIPVPPRDIEDTFFMMANVHEEPFVSFSYEILNVV